MISSPSRFAKMFSSMRFTTIERNSDLNAEVAASTPTQSALLIAAGIVQQSQRINFGRRFRCLWGELG